MLCTRLPCRLRLFRQVCGLKWSFDDKQLASGGNDNKLLIWNAHSTSPVRPEASNNTRAGTTAETGDGEGAKMLTYSCQLFHVPFFLRREGSPTDAKGEAFEYLGHRAVDVVSDRQTV